MFENLNNARVLLTGNTGFKGSWMSCLLEAFGIEVVGLSLPGEENRLFNELGLGRRYKTHFGNICDGEFVSKVFKAENPDLILHFAAQPLVLDSYRDPASTFSTNILGTSNVLAAGNSLSSTKATLIITTDKVYRNEENTTAFQEEDSLGGADPYSASKACAELVTQVWKSPALNHHGVEIASARAGNVIGGGDTSPNRLIPNMLESFMENKSAKIRNPQSVRPWQHVLDPLYGYLMLLDCMVSKSNLHSAYNFGPSPSNFLTVGEIADLVASSWGKNASWVEAKQEDSGLESNFLTIDSTRAKTDLGWECNIEIDRAIQWIIEWEKSSNKRATTLNQIAQFLEVINSK